MGRLTDWMRDQGGPAAATALAGVFGVASAALAGKRDDEEDRRADDADGGDSSDSGNPEAESRKSDSGDGGRNRDRADDGASSEGGRNRDGGGRNRDDNGDGGNSGDNGGDGGDHLNRQERLQQIFDRQHARHSPDAGNPDGGDNSGGDTYDSVSAQQAPPPVAPDAGVGTNGNASIQTPDGGVLAGYNPATQSMTATSGNVTASVGPGGPLVIISDEQVLNVDTGTSPDTPLPSPDQLPQPQPEPTQPPSPQPNPPPDGGNPNEPGFNS